MFDLFSLDPRLLFPGLPDLFVALLDLLILAVDVTALVLLIVAEWKLFRKFGEKPWKSLIPYYSIYILYKYTWKTSSFWVYIIATTFFDVLFNLAERLAKGDPEGMGVTLLQLLAIPFGIVAAVMSILASLRLAESFGKSRGYGVGLVLLNSIFTMILGFGKAKYVGPLAQADGEGTPDDPSLESAPENAEPAAVISSPESGKETV